MRILFLTQVLPYPLDAGPKIRAYYTLRYLSQQHEITLLSFVRPADSPEAVEHLRSFCRDVITVPMRRSRTRDAYHLLRSLANGTPFLIARDWIPEMAHRISHIADRELRACDLRSAICNTRHAIGDTRFDAIHADQLWMAQYALLAHNTQYPIPNIRLVLDQHNAVFQISRRLAQHETNPLKRALLSLEARKLARYEARICRQFDDVVWVTEEDRQAVMDQIRNPKPVLSPVEASEIRNAIIPICVDPDEQPVIQRRPTPHRVTFLGGLHWPPNAAGILWFAREVWPLVQREVPDAVLTIIGKNPPKSLSQMADGRSQGAKRNSKSPISNLQYLISNIQSPISNTQYPNLEVTGYLDDPTPYLAETAVFIVPLHAGGGMRVKILDAWCWGLPVVTTHVGAEGIRVRDGENALLVGIPNAVAGLPTAPPTPEAFAQAVVRVLRDPGLAARLAMGGRRTVETHYDWREVYRAWDRVYDPVRG